MPSKSKNRTPTAIASDVVTFGPNAKLEDLLRFTAVAVYVFLRVFEGRCSKIGSGNSSALMCLNTSSDKKNIVI